MTYAQRMDDALLEARKAVAAEVGALMGRRHMNQTQLAEAVGLKQSYLSRRLAAIFPFTQDDLYKIANYFEVQVADLIPATLPTDTRSGSSAGDLILVGAGS